MTDSRKLQIGFALAFVMTAFVVWLALREVSRPARGLPPAPVRNSEAPAKAPADPLAQAELAFVGGHSRADIKRQLDRALLLYGMPITDESYSRAGSTLVALRRETGVPEMSILDYMIRSHVPGVAMSFPNAAAMSAVFLQAGDK